MVLVRKIVYSSVSEVLFDNNPIFKTGDPDDRTLRRVELEIKIPQIMRDRAKTEKCAQEFKGSLVLILSQIKLSKYDYMCSTTDFGDCCIEAQYLMTFKCRPQNKKLMECMERW